MIENKQAQPSRICPHCRKPVIPSDIQDYVWQCLECDEDFYDIECYKVEE